MSSFRGLGEARNRIKEIGDPPCVVFKCDRWDDCATERISCQSFNSYVAMDVVKPPRKPNKGLYRQIFPAEDIPCPDPD